MAAGPKRTVLIMDGNSGHDWAKMFAGKTLRDGGALRIVQASWAECAITSYMDAGCMVQLAAIRDTEGGPLRPETIVVKPDFVIVRNQPRGPTPPSDMRHVLFGLMYSNIPCMNSCQSMYMCLERPIMFGALKAIEKRLGHDQFPLIQQNYYSSHKQMVISPDMPAVLKVSHAHAGMGKIQLKSSEEFRDVATILALHDPTYSTAEPFVDADYGIRIQKIGAHYRVYRKDFTGSGWKSQFGGASLTVVPLTDEYKRWADECAATFGGMDILAVDAMHGRDGKNYIIELNDTAIGIQNEHWNEDTGYLVDLAVEKMNALFIR